MTWEKLTWALAPILWASEQTPGDVGVGTVSGDGAGVGLWGSCWGSGAGDLLRSPQSLTIPLHFLGSAKEDEFTYLIFKF